MRERMMVRWTLNVTACGIAALCFFACARSAQALEAEPSYQTFDLKAGEKVSGELTLSNTDGVDLNVTPMIKDWFVSPANKKIKTSDWLKMDLKPFLLKNGEKRKIKFTAQAPKKAVGEVMGMLSFNTKAGEDAMLSFRLSLAVYVAIKGTEKKEGEVAAISVSASSDTSVSYLFVNRGNVHLRPKGLIKIFDDKDLQVLNVVYSPALPTYPGTKQAYTTRVKNYRLAPGHYRAEINLEDADWNIVFPPEKKKFEFKANGKTGAP
jgi:hypothetical protein